MSTLWRCWRKGQGIIEVSRIHPLVMMNGYKIAIIYPVVEIFQKTSVGIAQAELQTQKNNKKNTYFRSATALLPLIVQLVEQNMLLELNQRLPAGLRQPELFASVARHSRFLGKYCAYEYTDMQF